MITEAKPCPFCGGSADVWVVWSKRYPGKFITYVKCDVCGASSKAYAYGEDYDAENFEYDNKGVQAAYSAWNRRA